MRKGEYNAYYIGSRWSRPYEAPAPGKAAGKGGVATRQCGAPPLLLLIWSSTTTDLVAGPYYYYYYCSGIDSESEHWRGLEAPAYT